MSMPALSATPASVNPSSADVAKRAFELYCERGRQHGYDLQDWLQAERELYAAGADTAA